MNDRPCDVEITWTTQDVAHIRADDWYSLGFGQGYACARENLGTIWDMATKVRSERAKFHGAGPDGNFIASDLGYLALEMTARAEALRVVQPPEVNELVAGYVRGCNEWLGEARRIGALPAWCGDADWLVPLDEIDLYRMVVDTTLMASGRNLVGLIGRAEAPGPEGPVAPSPLSALGSANAASNGWAFGREATRSGGGLVVANPHFPWYGEARFFECHLTIPGELDVYGVSLIGMPGVQLGFNSSLAWTHTFSRGNRFTLYRLDLSSDDPTRYRFGDSECEMTPATHVVGVDVNGSMTTLERTLWSCHHGPMVNLPLLGWSNEIAFAYRDANIDNTGVLEMFLGLDRARDVGELAEVLATTRAMPWLNTLAADSTGTTYYIDASATPNLSVAAQQRFLDRLSTDPIAALLAANRVALLDGSEPDDTWIDEPGARSPGLVPHADLPTMTRDDVVVNCNDSHWLTHPHETLEGFSVFCGLERTPRSLRTRQNLIQTQLLVATGTLTARRAIQVILEGDTLTSLLLRDTVIARLRAAGEHPQAVEILEAWDGTVGLDARGAVLWREFLASFAPAHLVDAGPLFGDSFDPDNPVVTPHDLADPTGDVDQIVEAVGAALEALASAGVDPGVRLGDVQWVRCGEERVGVPGGGEVEGVANVVAPLGALASQSLVPVPDGSVPLPDRGARTGLGPGGYQVTYGTSFLMAVEMTPNGPEGLGLLAYGQSEDHRSSGALRAAGRLANRATRPLCFTRAAIDADDELRHWTFRSN